MWSEQQNVVQVEREANAQGSTPGIAQALGRGLAVKRRPEDLTPREQEIWMSSCRRSSRTPGIRDSNSALTCNTTVSADASDDDGATGTEVWKYSCMASSRRRAGVRYRFWR